MEHQDDHQPGPSDDQDFVQHRPSTRHPSKRAKCFSLVKRKEFVFCLIGLAFLIAGLVLFIVGMAKFHAAPQCVCPMVTNYTATSKT